MYVCIDCGRVFETPKQYRELIPGEPLPFDEWLGCPECAGDYVRTRSCIVCGDYIRGRYYRITGTHDYICDNCIEEGSIEDGDLD